MTKNCKIAKIVFFLFFKYGDRDYSLICTQKYIEALPLKFGFRSKREFIRDSVLISIVNKFNFFYTRCHSISETVVYLYLCLFFREQARAEVFKTDFFSQNPNYGLKIPRYSLHTSYTRCSGLYKSKVNRPPDRLCTALLILSQW